MHNSHLSISVTSFVFKMQNVNLTCSIRAQNKPLLFCVTKRAEGQWSEHNRSACISASVTTAVLLPRKPHPRRAAAPPPPLLFPVTFIQYHNLPGNVLRASNATIPSNPDITFSGITVPILQMSKSHSPQSFSQHLAEPGYDLGCPLRSLGNVVAKTGRARGGIRARVIWPNAPAG